MTRAQVFTFPCLKWGCVNQMQLSAMMFNNDRIQKKLVWLLEKRGGEEKTSGRNSDVTV